MATKLELTIEQTNNRLSNWYKNALEDYGVVGNGTARVEGNSFIVDYVENGVAKSWTEAYYPEYLDNGINWYFDCWAEEAN